MYYKLFFFTLLHFSSSFHDTPHHFCEGHHNFYRDKSTVKFTNLSLMSFDIWIKLYNYYNLYIYLIDIKYFHHPKSYLLALCKQSTPQLCPLFPEKKFSASSNTCDRMCYIGSHITDVLFLKKILYLCLLLECLYCYIFKLISSLAISNLLLISSNVFFVSDILLFISKSHT